MELTRRVRAKDFDTPVIIYTGYDIGIYFNILVDARVSGFISKTASREQLITAIRCGLRGEAVIPVSLLQQLRRNEARVDVTVNEDKLEGISGAILKLSTDLYRGSSSVDYDSEHSHTWAQAYSWRSFLHAGGQA